MTGDEKPAARKPRADAARNRAALVSAAKAVFTARGVGTSLEEVARAAGVGIGTLYRHFPTREALIEEVYRQESERLFTAAETLAAEHPPLEALRRWLLLSVEYLSTKQIVAEALKERPGGTSALYAGASDRLRAAMDRLGDLAAAAGTPIGLDPMDLLRAIAGIKSNAENPGWEASARQLITLMIDGIAAGHGR